MNKLLLHGNYPAQLQMRHIYIYLKLLDNTSRSLVNSNTVYLKAIIVDVLFSIVNRKLHLGITNNPLIH